MKASQNQKIQSNKQLFPITAEINAKGNLEIGGCDITDLKKQFGTPLYVFDEETFRHRANKYLDSLKKYYENFLPIYASKAFTCTTIFKILNSIGFGLDVVSGGELFTAIKANFNSQNIYFHGNNKSAEEIEMAIENNIGKFICDNFYELELINLISEKKSKQTEILLRLTPGIECHTHEYIRTGHLDSKFGFDLEYLDEILNLLKNKYKNIKLKGLHAHIGSQIFEIKPYTDTIEVLLERFKYIETKYGMKMEELNIGGGIGISYTQSDDPIEIDDWAKAVSSTIKAKVKDLNLKLPKLLCEPGRSISGPSGITLYTVGSSKVVPNGRKYVAVDGGMADNPRPITYQAKYHAVVGNKMLRDEKEEITIAGKYCESGDILIKDIELTKVEPNDIIVVLNTGAYNYSMSSNYNMMKRPACVLVNKGCAEVIIKRESYDDLIKNQVVPDRLN